MMVETYLRRGQRSIQRWMLDPSIRLICGILTYGGSGFLLSGASLTGTYQPLAVGLICALTGWRAITVCLGAMIGYPFFWKAQGRQGLVWAAAAGMLALLAGGREETREQPLMIPVITAFLTAVTGSVFFFLLRESVPVSLYLLRILLTFGSGVLFTQSSRQKDAVSGWLIGGITVLTLSRIAPVPWLRLGYVAAGIIGIRSTFPAAVVAGLGLDLAQVTQIPMTAVLSAAGLIRMIPFDKRWQHYASAGFSCIAVMFGCGTWDLTPLPGLLLGGAVASLLPPQPNATPRRGETGSAQVRLELCAAVMEHTGQLLRDVTLPPIDQEAIFQNALDRACGGCSARTACTQRQTVTSQVLGDPSQVTCRKQGRLQPELRRARDQLRYLQRDRQRLGEYRHAMQQQYRFLEAYLRSLADHLPRSSHKVRPAFRVEAAARSRGKERANGDRCLAFPGTDCRFYLLLCDGMGTGLEAAREGSATASLLRQLLGAGFPAEHALRSVNSLLVLRGSPGASTIDLAEVHLDTGITVIYKWGAAPSWVLHRSGAKKIGTASPPPGIDLNRSRETVEKLSLCRGEALILLSDGVDGEDVLHRLSVTPDAPPGELAAEILEKGCARAEDDLTAAVLRLRPVNLGTS